MAIDQVWKHDKFGGQGVPMISVNVGGKAGGASGGLEPGAKLLVSNLHFNVSTSDVKARWRTAVGTERGCGGGSAGQGRHSWEGTFGAVPSFRRPTRRWGYLHPRLAAGAVGCCAAECRWRCCCAS